MANENADLIRRAHQASARDAGSGRPDLKWTYLDPTVEHPPRRSATATTSWSRCCAAGPSTA